MLAPFSRLWAEPVLDSALRSEGLGSADRQRMQSTRRELSEREVTSLGPSFDLLPSAPARVQPPELSPRPRLLWRKRAPHPSHRSYPGSWVKVGRPSCFGEVTAAFRRLHRRQRPPKALVSGQSCACTSSARAFFASPRALGSSGSSCTSEGSAAMAERGRLATG